MDGVRRLGPLSKRQLMACGLAAMTGAVGAMGPSKSLVTFVPAAMVFGIGWSGSSALLNLLRADSFGRNSYATIRDEVGYPFREMGYSAQDVTWTIITFEDGAVVNLGVCYIRPAQYPTYGQSARFEVLGTDGVILLDIDNKDSVLFTDQGVPHAYVPDHSAKMLFMQSNSSGDWAVGDYWGPIANETRSWLDHLLTGRPCAHTTLHEGRLTLEVTLAVEAPVEGNLT